MDDACASPWITVRATLPSHEPSLPQYGAKAEDLKGPVTMTRELSHIPTFLVTTPAFHMDGSSSASQF